MPSPNFDRTIKRLSHGVAAKVQECLLAWKAKPATDREDWSQIAENIENETAITPEHFASLLESWVTEIRGGEAPEKAWTNCCNDRRGPSGFWGRKLEDKERPKLLGRAAPLRSYASLASGGAYSPSTLEDLLLLSQDDTFESEFPDLVSHLRSSPLGWKTVWATFSETDNQADPFKDYPESTDSVCTTLGLRLLPAPEVMIMLVYDREAYSSAPLGEQPILHRPTVFDAGSFPLFRPWHREEHPWGYTNPTPPNSHGLGGRPEVVHQRINGLGLFFPQRISKSI